MEGLLNTNMDGLLNALKFVHKMSADIIKSVCSSGENFVRCESCSFIGFYCCSYQEVVQFVVW